MAPHSGTLAWKIPWMQEPGGLQAIGSLRVGHDWTTSLSLFTFLHWRRKWQPTPVFLPGESLGRASLVGCRLWGHTVRHDWSDLTAAAATSSSPNSDRKQDTTWLESAITIQAPSIEVSFLLTREYLNASKGVWELNALIYFKEEISPKWNYFQHSSHSVMTDLRINAQLNSEMSFGRTMKNKSLNYAVFVTWWACEPLGQISWEPILALLHSSRYSLGRLLYLPRSQFPHL